MAHVTLLRKAMLLCLLSLVPVGLSLSSQKPSTRGDVHHYDDQASTCTSIVSGGATCDGHPSSKFLSRRGILQSSFLSGAAALISNSNPSYAATDEGTVSTGAKTITKPFLDGYNPDAAVTAPSAGQFFFPTLTPPFQNRATYRYELGRDAWALEQLLVFANVTATIRTVVIRMEDGGLWVNGPQWPTGEYCQLLDQLGPVKHVVVPCNALEHKAPTAAFVKKYPKASVWISPGQYGPFGSCGLDLKSCRMGYHVDGVLPVGDPKEYDNAAVPSPPWINEFDMRTLYVSLPENAGPVSESAFLHKSTNTLITTDAVVYVPDSPPPIFRTYFDDETVSEPSFWPKSVLQAVFLPLRQQSQAEPDVSGSSSMNQQWPGYGATQGRLIRAPILRAFADARAPDAVRTWVQSIPSMGRFDRILTAHFASPIAASADNFLDAFTYLDGPTNDPPISCQDWALLDSLNSFIGDNKLGAPVKFDFKAGCPPP